jgi:protein-export membrane protein SecD/preprotein translocase SecF subunit
MYFETLRSRLIVIGLLVAASIAALFPRDTKERYTNTQGVVRDTIKKEIPIKRGLDLQGGMHLALELDQSQQVSADPKKDIDLALVILRKRIDEFGVTEPLIQKQGDTRIVVELAGLTDPAGAKQIVQRSAFLEFRITDRTQALDKALPSMDRALRTAGVTIDTAAKNAAPSVVTQLLKGDSAKKDTTQAAGELSNLVLAAGSQGMPGEYLVPSGAYAKVDSLLHVPAVARLLPRNVVLRWSDTTRSVGLQSYRMLYALEDRPLITGSSLVDAKAELDPLTGGPIVTFELDRAGARKFGEGTAKHVNDFMAIILDNRVQGLPPVIQSRIDRRGQITMTGKTIQEAQNLALTLKAGALPVPLKIVDQLEVGPNLGKDSIRDGIVSGLVGTALVVIIMLGYYHMSGALAVAGLAFYILFTLAALAMLDATLTLPGIAGLVLSIGIAVDANVLIFERIREELALGKTVRLSIDEGFRHAMNAIVDSNVTTVLTALFLFQFGTGPVKGFAVTLTVGIIASMITAVFVVRTFYMIWLERQPDALSLSVGRTSMFAKANYDFIAFRKYAYGLTGAILLVGVVSLAIFKLNYSIEFTGGTLVQIQTTKDIDVGKLRSGLDASGLKGNEIQSLGGVGRFAIRVRVGHGDKNADDTQAAAAAVKQALDATLGAGTYTQDGGAAVGPKVGGELRQQAFLAIFLSFFAVLAYLAWRFEWRFGLAAVAATAHDILATIAFISVMRLEVSLVVVAAVLSMVGYSLNDTIIIFDRVRENLHKYKRDHFVDILNRSINETLPRSILTHGTALSTLLALAVFGGEVIRPFALVMFFGVFTGTFSSIFIAGPVLMAIEKKWPGAEARGTKTVVAPVAGRAMPAGTK